MHFTQLHFIDANAIKIFAIIILFVGIFDLNLAVDNVEKKVKDNPTILLENKSHSPLQLKANNKEYEYAKDKCYVECCCMEEQNKIANNQNNKRRVKRMNRFSGIQPCQCGRYIVNGVCTPGCPYRASHTGGTFYYGTEHLPADYRPSNPYQAPPQPQQYPPPPPVPRWSSNPYDSSNIARDNADMVSAYGHVLSGYGHSGASGSGSSLGECRIKGCSNTAVGNDKDGDAVCGDHNPIECSTCSNFATTKDRDGDPACEKHKNNGGLS